VVRATVKSQRWSARGFFEQQQVQTSRLAFREPDESLDQETCSQLGFPDARDPLCQNAAFSKSIEKLRSL
jgi:hypothetical protein